MAGQVLCLFCATVTLGIFILVGWLCHVLLGGHMLPYYAS